MVAILSLRAFGVSFHERVILRGVELDVPSRGLTFVMGPAAGGKSTLLRAIGGLLHERAEARVWGAVTYHRQPLGVAGGPGYPAVVAQKTRLMTASILDNLIGPQVDRSKLTRAEQRELARQVTVVAGLAQLGDRLDEPVVDLPIGWQRRLAIVRTMLARPALLCVDEPTAELPPAEADAILRLLAAYSEHAAVMMVTHNQAQAQRLGGQTILLVGGRIVERGLTSAFFAQPQTVWGCQFIRTGGCGILPPADDYELESGALAAEAKEVPPSVQEDQVRPLLGQGPRGFVWLWRGKLGGVPRPGLLRSLESDLELLHGLGITTLVCLTAESPPVAAQSLARFGLASLWLPVPDMEAPAPEDAWQLCVQIQSLLDQGQRVAVHCRAGLGRTGTLLAAQLIVQERCSAAAALERVRGLEPRWVQSVAQVEFLDRFAVWVEQKVTVEPDQFLTCAASID